ncbi:ribosome recycling factor family protein [Vibrio rarus]|uniref:ribosome recycling factor family protein n=1 Tax=Vibrio rarus TaxID=413403 RepID=UPI0021C30441|nr:ribosome recycling factor family protein [Vibrio rarus]
MAYSKVSVLDANITVALPSLLHRMPKTRVAIAKELAQQHTCQLKRVRRSRHWQLTGQALDIQNVYHQLILAPEGLEFLIKKIQACLLLHQDKLHTPQQRLKQMLLAEPNMTLSQLMEMTQCSLVEARRARFDADEL